MTGLPVRLGVLRGLVKEISVDGGSPLAVGGARELAPLLRKELARGAAPGGVRPDDAPEGAAVLVYVLAHDPGGEDEEALRRARRARVPIVAVAGRADVDVPYVLATDVVPLRAGEGFPVERIARVVAARLGEDAAPLAKRVPALRRAVRDELVAGFARRNGVVGTAVFLGGADMPVLTLNQLRLLLRLEQAHGLEIDPRERLPEIAATLAGGLGLRALTRTLVARAPEARWAIQGAVAYLGTRALGEAAVRVLEARPRSHQLARDDP